MKELLSEREVPGPVKHRGQLWDGKGPTPPWLDLWRFSYLQEETHKASENDKRRALRYALDLMDRAEEMEKPLCRWHEWNSEDCRRR